MIETSLLPFVLSHPPLIESNPLETPSPNPVSSSYCKFQDRTLSWIHRNSFYGKNSRQTTTAHVGRSLITRMATTSKDINPPETKNELFFPASHDEIILWLTKVQPPTIPLRDKSLQAFQSNRTSSLPPVKMGWIRQKQVQSTHQTQHCVSRITQWFLERIRLKRWWRHVSHVSV